MIISYPTAHKWYKELTTDPKDGLSGSLQSRLIQFLDNQVHNRVYHTITPLDTRFLDVFVPFYTTRITSKEHPLIADIAEKTLYSTAGYPYFALSMYEGTTFKGGTIFSVREKYLSIAYRMYDTQWDTIVTRTTPALYTEYLICEHALSLGKTVLSHGKDRNPYGYNASIGLAIFKLSVGCIPYAADDFEVRELNTETVTDDILILKHVDSEERRYTDAVLLTKKDTEGKWTQVTKYPHLLKVEVMYRN